MYVKWLSRHSFAGNVQIKHLDIKLHQLDNEHKKYLFRELYTDFKKNYKPHLHIVDETQIYSYTTDGFSALLNDIEKLFIEETGHGIDLIFVDHIQLLKFDENSKKISNETSIINYWVDYFRKQCMNFLNTKRQIAIILLSQANREGWKYAQKEKKEKNKSGKAAGDYLITALAEANELERASSMVISVFTSDALKQLNQAKVQLLKCRDGQTMDRSIETDADLAYYAFGDKVKETNTTPTFDNSGTDLSTLLQTTQPEDLDTLLKKPQEISGGFDDLDLGV